MKLGDLFIKLGLQKGDFDKGIDDAKKKTGGLGGSFKQLGTMAAGVWAAVGVGAVFAFNKIKDSTDTLSTRWEVFMGGMTGATNEFFRSLAVGDWSNFIDNMKEAVRVGREYQSMLDEIEEQGRALSVQEANKLKENTQLEIDAANKSLSLETRKAAAEKRIKNEEELADIRIKLAQKVYENEKMITQQQTRLSAEQVERVVSDFDSIDKQKAKSINEYYDELKKTVSNLSGEFGEKSIEEKLLKGFEIRGDKLGFTKFVEGFSQSEIDYAKALRQMGDTTDEQLNKMVDAYTKLKQAEESVIGNTRRIRQRLGAMLAGEESGADSPFKNELAAIKAVNEELEAQRILRQEFKGEKMTELTPIGTPDRLTGATPTAATFLGNMDSMLNDVAEKRKQWTEEELQSWTDFTNDLNSIIASGMGDAIGSLAEGFGAMIGSGQWDWKNFGANILKTVGQFMQTLGGLFVAYGIANLKFMKALSAGPTPLGAGLAIAAGIGLIAAGAAISSFAGKGMTGSTATSAASGYSNSGYSGSNAVAAISGNVVFELQGTMLKGVLNNTDRKNTLIR